MREKLLAASPLVVAALADLPVVYGLVPRDDLSPAVALAFGFLAMGLAWAAGFVIEGRRRAFSLFVCGLGVAEGAAALVPIDYGANVRPWMGAVGLLSVVGAVLVART